MKKLMNSQRGKWIIIGMSVILVAVISSMGTWLYINQRYQEKFMEETSTERSSGTGAGAGTGDRPEAGIEAGPEDGAGAGAGTEVEPGATGLESESGSNGEIHTEADSELEADFLIMVEEIKELAHSFSGESFGSQYSIFKRIHEYIKEIITSEYAPLLNNDTFCDDHLTVVIQEYPLQNNDLLKAVQLTVKDSETIVRTELGTFLYESSYFFLQYISENNSFLSELRGSFLRYDLHVIENEENWCVIIVGADSASKAFNTENEHSYCGMFIFTPEENEFLFTRVRIPMEIFPMHTISLVRDDDKMKVVVYDTYDIELNIPLCVFDISSLSDPSSLSFEFPPMSFESEPVSYDFPGLLLGLSNSQGDLRTLFIRKENDRIYSNEYRGQIVFLRKGQLYSLTQHMTDKSIYYSENFEPTSDMDFITGGITIKKLICNLLGKDIEFDFGIQADAYWVYRDYMDIPLYVGEEYVCYLQKNNYTKGGAFESNSCEIRFDKLDHLSDFAFENALVPKFKETKLAELIYGNKVKDFSTYSGGPNPFVELDQLVIKRNIGEWSLMLPIIYEDFDPGTLSNSRNIYSFAAFSDDVPAYLTSNVKVQKWPENSSYWYVKDLLQFPDTNTYLAQYDHTIEIYNSEESNGREDLRIPIAIDEYIVSISFANSDEQELWKRELEQIEQQEQQEQQE